MTLAVTTKFGLENMTIFLREIRGSFDALPIELLISSFAQRRRARPPVNATCMAAKRENVDCELPTNVVALEATASSDAAATSRNEEEVWPSTIRARI